MARSRLAGAPSVAIYAASVMQLEYLMAVLERKVAVDRAKLRDIMVGQYSTRALQRSDAVFANALTDAQGVAARLAQGLRPD